MKKFVSIALALVLALSLTVVAFAADVTTDDDLTATVEIEYAALVSNDAYAAEIDWNVNKVAYGAGTRTWDTENMKWGATTGAQWGDSDAGSVTVNNFSNKAITVSVTTNSSFLTVSGGTSVAAAAEPVGEATTGTAGTATWTIAATGTPTAGSTATITVALS